MGFLIETSQHGTPVNPEGCSSSRFDISKPSFDRGKWALHQGPIKTFQSSSNSLNPFPIQSLPPLSLLFCLAVLTNVETPPLGTGPEYTPKELVLPGTGVPLPKPSKTTDILSKLPPGAAPKLLDASQNLSIPTPPPPPPAP